ncbi:Protein of unknown function [Pedobacter westerhofensis]|uniref:DUF2911 domain-containing protein n=1 Tax=Pedobacter westerhofensis TaxID=425512 RepID=A0A521FRW8_9SPHI|nr:DUF2911 domain-containing protein [Pedobacter westerhofensis]SMO98231.1 Protein of unknown function [Pedobacter westerhofensis]
MKLTKLKAGLLTVALLVISYAIWAKQNQPSPAATAKGTVNGANITIEYSSPGVKGRKIWGELVPYDSVWRAGANKATTFTTDKKITVEGKSLDAGSYSIYTIPGAKTWRIIFNSETGQWGTTHDGVTTRVPAKDVLTVTVTPTQSSALEERLKYLVTPKGFELVWENLSVPVAIK